MHWNLMNEEESGSLKLLKFKYRNMGPVNSALLQNWFLSRNLVPHISFLKMLKAWETYSWITQKALKSDEWRRIWVLKTFKSEIRKRGTKKFTHSAELIPRKKLDPPYLICENLETPGKVFLSHAEWIET